MTAGDRCEFAHERRALTLLADALTPGPPWLLLADGETAPAGDASARTLVLPAAIGRHAAAADNRAAYRLALLLQVLRDDGEGPRFDRDAWLAMRPPGIGRRRLRLLFELLEAHRVAARVVRRFPGAVADLDRERERARQRRAARSRSADSARAAGRDTLADHLLGTDPIAPGAATRLSPLLQRIDALRDEGAQPWHSAELALALARRFMHGELGAAAVGVAPLAADEESTGVVGEAAPASAEASAATAPGDSLAGTAADSSAGHRRRGAGAGTRLATRAAGAGLAPTPTPDETAPAAARPATASARLAIRRHFVDEWDYRHRRYRRAWCTIEESRASGHGRDFLAALQRRHRDAARALARRIARLRLPEPGRPRPADDGDEIDLERAVDGVAERRAGHGDDRPPYRQRPVQRPPVCAALLLDTSASTDFPLKAPPGPAVADPLVAPAPDRPGGASLYEIDELPAAAPAPPRPRVIDLARDALALMAQALHGLGDRHAIWAFDGEGRHHVRLQRVKGFAEPPSAATWGALAGLVPRGATRTGAAVRHVTAALAAEDAARKLLFVVTDGYPEDSDYGGPPRDLDHGLHDTARALQEAERRGIATFCIAIDHAGHDYLRRMCPPRRYLVIDDVATLVDGLAGAYLALRARG